MFKKYDLAKIEQKLNMGQPAPKMFVYTVSQKQYVDRTAPIKSHDEMEVEYFCKVLEGCGFSL